MSKPDLRKLAENATEGPWIRDHTDVCVDNEHKTLVAETRCASDAAYIAAANPEAVIELMGKLDRLTSRGFEDLHHENEQLKTELKLVVSWVKNWDVPFLEDHEWLSDYARIKLLLENSND